MEEALELMEGAHVVELAGLNRTLGGGSERVRGLTRVGRHT